MDSERAPRTESPVADPHNDLSALSRTQISHIDERHPRNSLPHNRIDPPSHTIQRSETLPSSVSTDGPTMILPADFVKLVKNHLPEDLLILDLRVNPQYSKSRIREALNLCIPTTLLKRASFDIKKLSETFTKDSEKAKFAAWRKAKFIIVYDANSMQLKDATSSVNTLRKFTNDDYHGSTFVIRGGFNVFSQKFPDQVDDRPASDINHSNAQKLSIDPPAAAPVAGGCIMPVVQNAANPFFANIRQNMDLIGGVGQIPVNLPKGRELETLEVMPKWLIQVTPESDKGKTVAERFLTIEKDEQRRMQKALSCTVKFGTPNPLSPEAVQIAGIEKGAKNRYKDMLPYDHARVKLQDVPTGGCDYVNASHIRASCSAKNYIACQAPVPSTFDDFWRMIWEQDARLIIMLSAETDGGQRKVHPYWYPGEYGSFKLTLVREETKPLDHNKKIHSEPYALFRTLKIQRLDQPSEWPREIMQVQYDDWPDFGAPADPEHVLDLVKNCNDIACQWDMGDRPMIVHCSAGCGRTGTFCTIDSVVDALKWGERSESEDLIAATVADFRRQRLSMVQTLRQFVLCYETVLASLARPEPIRKRDPNNHKAVAWHPLPKSD